MTFNPEPRHSLAIYRLAALSGGPLKAAVQAQAKAAGTSINFIRAIALKDNGDIVTVVFRYIKENATVELVVPILTIVPIPYLRIDNMTIAFKAKISADTRTHDESKTETEKKIGGGGGWPRGRTASTR